VLIWIKKMMISKKLNINIIFEELTDFENPWIVAN